MTNKLCPSALDVMECYFALRRETALIQATVWMNLRNMILSERNGTKRVHAIG